MKYKTKPLTVIAGSTRNLLSERDSLQRRRWRMLLRHDGRGARLVFPSLSK